MVTRKYCAIPLERTDVNTDEDFIKAAKEYGYYWSREDFKEVLDSNKFDLHGMWIKTIEIQGA